YFNLGSIDPRNFQLFLRGKEQFLYIKGESDGEINIGDYLEFYADPSMREIDSLVYTNIAYVPNPYGPIFNDTIYGFLTLNNTISKHLHTLKPAPASAAYPAADHVYHEKIYSFMPHYNYVQEYTFEVSDPHYTLAEGRGTIFTKGNSAASAFSNL